MKHKAHMYFWIMALLIVLVGGVLQLTSSKSTMIDVNVGDTYYVTPAIYFAVFLAFIYFMLGVCYWFFYKLNILLNKKLTKIHTVITVLGLPAYLLLNKYIEYKSEEPLFVVLGNYAIFNRILIGLFLAVLLVQLLLPVNLLIGLIKRKKA